ncbi:hypothetical protein SAMN05216503_1722 [Polaribacter sp. KT25b]|uniref:hypothetical protein n=1 Tax=Polaribacter sp. KT25b TaxID=1855336 RepID=UPI000879F8AE|nr:hypothetical protein [Polaribacter sp. KT25b]SDS02287.1 hypothetical protein SAMN05216503_1722 [Polaribacter sp. KT25b]
MKKILLFTAFSFLLIACSSIKNTQEAINNGNYDFAINTALENLKKNKAKKGNQPYVFMIQEAFAKATAKDLDRISFLKKDQNPENIETIYGIYNNLKNRQEAIKPLLPLRILENGNEAEFNFHNYDDEIIANKNQLSDYLYLKARKLFDANNKFDYRTAFDDLEYIEKINPNFKDVRNLINIAHERGLDYVIVSMKNETQKVITKRLEEDLLNFDTYGLNDLWTVYHGYKNPKIKYDFGLELNLRDIQISPEQVREKQIIKQKEVKDGFKYLLDKDGNQVLDQEGNKIKVDKMIKVRCELYQFTQFKSSKVIGQVKYVDLNTRQIIETYPIESSFSFQHIYAKFKGDKRALEDSFLDQIALKVVLFPTNEQMIYDSGQDLKERLKSIITRNNFRN